MGVSGIRVYIKTSYASVKKRVGSLSKRGVVIRKGSTLLDLFNERTPLYEKYADLTVDVDGLTIEQAIEKIRQALQKILE